MTPVVPVRRAVAGGGSVGKPVMTEFKSLALRWRDDRLELLDQRLLPGVESWLELYDAEAVAGAIRDLVVRGAPAIGVTAAYGMVLAASAGDDLDRAAAVLIDARPTAVNLAWAVNRVGEAARRSGAEGALAEARRIHAEDIAACDALAAHGADLFAGDAPVEILTHCNTGALATAGIGTALGIVRELARRGRLERLWACEARPVMQGSRLTAWEAMRLGLPVTLLTDTAAGSVFARRPLAAVVLGADRIAADGATANKVGTYTLAVLAARHGVRFMVAAPTSTVDLSTPNGMEIPIEERGPDEVRRCGGRLTAPPNVAVYNPAFDVTPPGLIAAIVTERGVARPPFGPALARLCRNDPE